MPSIKSVLLGTAALLASTSAHAVSIPSLPAAGKFSVTPSIGTAFTVGGDFVKSGAETVAGSGTFGGTTVTGSGTITVGSKSFDDVYNTPISLGLAGNYGLTNSDSVSLEFNWLHADGKTFDAGTSSFNGTINGVAVTASGAFQAKFDNYNEARLALGYRHFISLSNSSIHPFIGASFGGAHTDSIGVDLSEGGTNIGKIAFFGSGWTLTGGLEAGARVDFSPSLAVGLATGVRYTDKLSSNHSDLTGDAGTIDSVNSGGSRWDIPVMLEVTKSF